MFKRLDNYWFGPVSARPLAAFRIGFTLSILIYFSLRLISYQEAYLASSITRLPFMDVTADPVWRHLQPVYIPALSTWAVACAAVLLAMASGGLLLGYRARACALILAVWTAFITLADWLASFSINRSAVLILGLMAVSPLCRVWSIDARRRGDRSNEFISAWSIRTLQWFLVSWYVASGVDKLRGGWLTDPDVLWTQLQGWYETPAALWALNHLPPSLLTGAQVATVGFEVLAPILLIPKRLRPFGLGLGVMIHIGVAILMSRLWPFSLYMLSFYLLFLEFGGDPAADVPLQE